MENMYVMMNSLVEVRNNQVVVDSWSIAKNFAKRHDHVIRDIRRYKKDVPNFGDMFTLWSQKDSYGRLQDSYLMNRDGFSLLVMGFRGPKALTWKLAYIQAFNRMEQKLRESQSNQSTQVLPQNYLQALEALVASEKEKQRIQSELQIAAPKASYYDDCMDSTTTFTTTAAAKELGFQTAANLNRYLYDHGVLYRAGWRKGGLARKPVSAYPWVPTVAYDFLLSDGYAKMITGAEYRYMKWTNKGIKWLKEFASNSI